MEEKIQKLIKLYKEGGGTALIAEELDEAQHWVNYRIKKLISNKTLKARPKNFQSNYDKKVSKIIISLWNEGATTQVIADELNGKGFKEYYTDVRVKYLALKLVKASRLKPRKKCWHAKPEHREEIIAMRGEGLSLTEIANELGVSRGAICTRISRMRKAEIDI